MSLAAISVHVPEHKPFLNWIIFFWKPFRVLDPNISFQCWKFPYANLIETYLKQNTSEISPRPLILCVTPILLPYRCEANCKPVNVSDDVVLSVSGQEDSQAIYYNWYLDNTFQNKVRAPDLSEILHTQK